MISERSRQFPENCAEERLAEYADAENATE
jgi:hypothetical protein